MSAESFKYILMFAYIAVTYWLSTVGMRRAKSLKSFSIGNKDMSPVLIGITMAASIASSATFVINPGFVYTHGLSAYLHFGVAATLGVIVAFLTLCKGFRSFGDSSDAITIPHWIYNRFGSRSLSLLFAFINLFTIAFIVLILVGCALLASSLFGISQMLATTLVLLFVFSYVLLGGAYAHAYTNAVQGVMMLVITVFLVIYGAVNMDGGFLTNLNSVGENFAAVFNPDSNLYYDAFSVFFSSFIVSFALMLQPHILTKTLYLKGERDVNRFLVTAIVCWVIFTLMLLTGFYAKFAGIEAAQDKVVVTYLLDLFQGSGWGQMVMAFVMIALLAAGMSTLDGILVALSAMVINDIYTPLAGKPGEKQGLLLSRLVLVGVGLGAYGLALDPPQYVGLFAQKGVYGLAAASFVPITFGVLWKGPIPAWSMWVAALIGVVGHLIMNQFWFPNPSVSASWAMLASLAGTAIILTLASRNKPET